MKLLPKQISSEEYVYYSSQSVEELKYGMEQLSEERRGWKVNPNLCVEFVDASNFRVRVNRSPYFYRGFDTDKYESSTVTIEGCLSQSEFNHTQVNFTLRPSLFFSFSFFFNPLFGIALIISSFINFSYELRIFGFCALILGPISVCVFAFIAKNRLKNAFVDAFTLKPFK
ncbi:hypothetical protein F0919_15095 [Taibaiella lutea]|uniref:Uncharacterized protein n=1 Tax=Taibaiella lutea TaxID=2608001 RepID=A0A5M6CAD5_9BACT|nr:hypothetical protein [Taibaiella lutea]KAA5532126.1 hypothetical protein F0919_15095 [Taibaiella lutea]